MKSVQDLKLKHHKLATRKVFEWSKGPDREASTIPECRSLLERALTK